MLAIGLAIPAMGSAALGDVDVTAPTFSSASPADGATGVAALPTLVLTFSENVVAGTGTFGIRETGGSTFETFTSSLGTGNKGGTITFSGDEATITPGYGMDPSGAYHMEWATNAVADGSGNPVAVNTDATVYNWTISATAPTVSGVSGTATSGTTATWAATSDTAGGTMIAAVVVAGDPAPTKYEIITDQPNVSGLTSTDATPTADGNNGGTFTGLEENTDYDTYVIHIEANGGTNAPVKSASTFTTSGATPPVADSITVGTQASDGDIPITVTNLDVDATGSKGVLTTSATPPTAAQVIAGTDHTDTAASLAFDFSVTTGSPTDTVSTGSLTTGTYYVYTVLGDSVPNYSTTAYSGGSVAVDLTAPTFDSGSPADGASTVAVDSAFVLTFSENVTASTGTFSLVETGVGTVETFDTDAGTGDDTPAGTISVSGTDVTITPGSDLSNSTDYHITWTASAVVDAYGNAVAAETGATAYNFTTASGASTPTVLAFEQDSSDSVSQWETPAFTPSSGHVLVAKIGGIDDISTSGGGSLTSLDIGTASRSYGTGTTYNAVAGEFNSRAFARLARWNNPGTSEITCQLEWSNRCRSITIEIWEYPGDTASQAGAQNAVKASGTSETIGLTTTAAGSTVALLAVWNSDDGVITWAGADVDAEGTNRTSHPSNGAVNTDNSARGAYKVEASTGAKTYDASIDTGTNHILCAMEIEA